MASDDGKRYVVILHPNPPDDEDGPDAYGPLTLDDAIAARESVLRNTPHVGIEIAFVSDIGDLFAKLRLP